MEGAVDHELCAVDARRPQAVGAWTIRSTPAAERALADEDPAHGLVSLIEAAMGLAARELNILAAAHNAGALTAEVYTLFEER